ncbi:hypothetical protein HYH03_001381 [Edaphochlamys debaryana]|uniref:Uncharacterized protein n=1 Tax=Edaphochlamys debaryana TaxID=47281 RepID=A0A835YMW7_9CHLO|nr:hypothetical protein HYH03_001381 [Edaphochlamys debaryana]|eukprot:KAG2500614.1 hypothetical protein HYH03_001381 [Edaphochlamys debaryana]
MLAAKTALPARAAGARRTFGARAAPVSSRRVAARAIDDTNFFINILGSGLAGAAVAAVTTYTAENRDKEIEKIQTVDGALPIGAAVAVDAIAHSIPGLNVIFNLIAEPVGAACGVAYMMTLILSAPSVDPNTLAPEGTVLNAKKAEDSRAAIRVPFTKLIPTALKVVDTSNEASSGAGWTIGENGLPKLPINSVLIVLGVGGVILEAAAHAPVMSFFLPRVLTMAAWYAAVGFALDKAGKA